MMCPALKPDEAIRNKAYSSRIYALIRGKGTRILIRHSDTLK
jgi:hypothetical protein